MPVAILLGMIRPHLQRIRTAVERADAVYRVGWSVEYIAARHRMPEIGEAEMRTALQLAATQAGAHIIGVSKQDGEVRQRVAAGIRQFFRFRWLDNRLLSHIGPNVPNFIEAVNNLLIEEEAWAAQVQPKTVTSPLLLPKSCFEVQRPFHNLWDLAEQFGDASMIPAAARSAQKFEHQYWKPKQGSGLRWTDHADRIFDHTGPLHGIAPPPRGWKYSFALPQGFHYDVTTAHGRAFTLWDPLGTERAADDGGHLNVDPHGYIR